MTELDYKKDLEIDRYYLDEICDTHSNKFMQWAEAHADALLERDITKEKLDLRYAELDDYARKNKDEIGVSTEPSIKSWIQRHPDYQALSERFLQATHKVNVLKGARDAFDHRKSMIESNVKLYVAGFWAKPAQPKEVREEKAQERNEEIGRSVSEKVKKRRFSRDNP